MQHFRSFLLLHLLALPVLASAAGSPFAGRWKLDTEHSSALDGWHDWELVIRESGTQVEFRYDMRWGRTRVSETNTFDTAHDVLLTDFFRVSQRHMAVYPAPGEKTKVTAAWIDNGRTLRVEATTPLEISQGRTEMRIYSEYRLLEGDDSLLLIELHNSRPQPLVYRFNRVKEEN